MSYHMYVSNSGSNHLSHFLMDEETGGLAAQPDIDLGGAPGALATDAEQRWLFACMRSQQEFVTYAIDRSSGALPRVDGVSAGSAPYIYVDDTDSYLLATYYGEGAVSVHGIDGEGKLSTQPLQWIETAGHAPSIQGEAVGNHIDDLRRSFRGIGGISMEFPVAAGKGRHNLLGVSNKGACLRIQVFKPAQPLCPFQR